MLLDMVVSTFLNVSILSKLMQQLFPRKMYGIEGMGTLGLRVLGSWRLKEWWMVSIMMGRRRSVFVSHVRRASIIEVPFLLMVGSMQI